MLSPATQFASPNRCTPGVLDRGQTPVATRPRNAPVITLPPARWAASPKLPPPGARTLAPKRRTFPRRLSSAAAEGNGHARF